MTSKHTEEAPTLDALARRALARDPTEPALEFDRVWINWGDMARVANAVRAAIAASGAGPRAPVALVARNRPAALAALLGLIAEARTVKMIYAYQSPAALAREMLRLKTPVLIAVDQDCSEDVRAAAREHGVAVIALTGMDAAPLPGLAQARLRAEDDTTTPPRVEVLTSGTTGPPKQFPLSYELIAKHYVGFNLYQQSEPAKKAPVLLFMPLGNISGVYTIVPVLVSGQRGVLVDRFTVEGWRDHLLRFRPEQSGLPPAGYQMVLDAKIPKEDLASIKMMGAGAAPLDPTVHRAFEDHYGIPILLSYGATEFGGPVVAWTPELYKDLRDKKFGSVGRPIPGADVRIVDPETGAPAPANQEGLVEVISPRLPPNWIRTSDVGVLDEDGFLFLRGRADGAIMRGGFKLLPETIERALLLHPAIADAGVVGIKDRRLGQVPAAAVQFKPGMDASVADLEAHLRQHVPATHIPTHWRVVEALPRTPSVKTDRPALRTLFADADA